MATLGLQNDLVHGWGLDFALRKCVEVSDDPPPVLHVSMLFLQPLLCTFGISSELIIQTCLQPAHEKIGVVDSQWIVHQTVPSLGSQVRSKFSPLSFFHVLSNQFLHMGLKYLVHLLTLVG